MNELISIIIPTYNHAQYLERCLNSIETQSFKNYEIIIIDNHSEDNTKSIIDNFKHLPIKYLLIHNKGIYAKSRNLGIKNSSGNIIAFLDSDDWWKETKLHECYKLIQNGYDMIYHNLEVVNSENKKITSLKGRILKEPKFKDLIINGNQICNSSVVIKKTVLEKVNFINENNKMKAAEDYNTWIKVSLNNYKIFYLNQNLGYYQYHDAGGSRKNMLYCTLQAIKEFRKLLNLSQYNLARSRIFFMYAKYLFEKKKYKKSFSKFKISFFNGTKLIKFKSLIYLLKIIFKK